MTIVFVTVPGCGDDHERPISTAPTAPAATQADPGAHSKTNNEGDTLNTDPVDGRLTAKNGGVITDYGNRRDRIAAVRALAQLQQDFRAGRMGAACLRVSDFLLSQFTPGRTTDDTPCPRKLVAFAAQRERRNQEPERMKLLWVRSYSVQAGIWVDDQHGARLRVQMTPESGVGWQYDLGAMNRPDVLAADLVGADNYGKR